jgi:hypothetical protein
VTARTQAEIAALQRKVLEEADPQTLRALGVAPVCGLDDPTWFDEKMAEADPYELDRDYEEHDDAA